QPPSRCPTSTPSVGTAPVSLPAATEALSQRTVGKCVPVVLLRTPRESPAMSSRAPPVGLGCPAAVSTESGPNSAAPHLRPVVRVPPPVCLAEADILLSETVCVPRRSCSDGDCENVHRTRAPWRPHRKRAGISQCVE